MTAWLTAAEEMEVYEGVRRGDAQAFRAIAEPLQPTLRRLAGLYVDSPAAADELVLRTWGSALRGLHMFAWNTPFATWIARITVAFGHTQAAGTEPPGPPPPAPASAEEVPGPPDWSDLPWSARWADAGTTLADALAALPTPEHEVVHGRHLERWPPQRVCDVFGLPRSAYRQRLSRAHTRLHRELAALVGQTEPGPDRAAQIDAITGWLNQRLDTRPETVDPRAWAIFDRWVATRRGRWRWLAHQLRAHSRPDDRATVAAVRP